MIYAISNVYEGYSSDYTPAKFIDFMSWIQDMREFQLDIETTMTDWWCDKELITIQFGDIWGKEQWVIRWPSLKQHEKDFIKYVLEDKSRTKLIHNGQFEYVVLRFHGIILENIYDTLLAEQVLNGGLKMEKGYYSLGGYTTDKGHYTPGLTDRYLGYKLGKTEQTGFTHAILRPAQIVYAADDVKPLGAIRRMQIDLLKVNLQNAPLEYTAALEMEALLSYGDMIYNGMEMDKEAWLNNLDLVEPIIAEAEQKLYDTMQSDPRLQAKAIELGYICIEDTWTLNWNSPPQKLWLLKLLDPDIGGSSKMMLNKLIKENHPHKAWLELFVTGDYKRLEQGFLDNFKDQLLDEGYFRPAGDISMNWNSPDILKLFKAVDPKLKGLSKEALFKFVHPIGKMKQNYAEALKLRTTYGEEFLNNHVEPDGKIRTTFNQVLTTGRISSSKPNMQNIPAKDSVGNRYRNCFTCSPGWKYVDGDYTGQELCIIAYLSKDPIWTEALEKRYDIHSVCAEMVWPEKWSEAKEPNCAYFAIVDGVQAKQKCDCKKHKPIRYDVKSVDFGLAYGMTEYKLASDAEVTVQVARQIIKDYFKAFPKIGRLLDYLGRFGVEHGFIQTAWPFYRKRFFPEWKDIPAHIIEAHLEGIVHDWRLGAIERASKNMPIQGTAGDMVKISICMIRWFLQEHNLQEKILQVMQVHDQNTTIAIDELAEWWKPELKRIMEEAAYFLIPNGLVKSDINITDRWSK